MTDKVLMLKMLAAMEHGINFIRNGIALGYIRMPDADCSDSAHDTLPKLQEAATALRARLADGERQEPAAWMCIDHFGDGERSVTLDASHAALRAGYQYKGERGWTVTPLFIAPPTAATIRAEAMEDAAAEAEEYAAGCTVSKYATVHEAKAARRAAERCATAIRKLAQEG